MSLPVTLIVSRASIRPSGTGATRSESRDSTREAASAAAGSLMDDSRYRVTTDASDKSALNMSPSMNCTRFRTPGSLRVPAGLGDKAGIELDTHSARAAPGGGDDDASVAGAEIVDHILGSDGCDVQHRLDDLGWRRHEVDVRGPLHALSPGLGQPHIDLD